MEYIDRTELLQKHSEKWVALTDDDQVICSGDNPDKVLSTAKKKGFNEPTLTKVFNPKYDYLLA